MNTVTDRLRSRQSSAVLSLSRLWCFRAIPYTGTSELCEETERWMINTGAYKSSRSWSVILTSLWWWWTFRGNSNNSRLFFFRCVGEIRLVTVCYEITVQLSDQQASKSASVLDSIILSVDRGEGEKILSTLPFLEEDSSSGWWQWGMTYIWKESALKIIYKVV